jgi:hypothetical protein
VQGSGGPDPEGRSPSVRVAPTGLAGASVRFSRPFLTARVTNAAAESQLQLTVTVLGAGPPPDPNDPLASTRVDTVDVFVTTPEGVELRTRCEVQRLIWL